MSILTSREEEPVKRDPHARPPLQLHTSLIEKLMIKLVFRQACRGNSEGILVFYTACTTVVSLSSRKPEYRILWNQRK